MRSRFFIRAGSERGEKVSFFKTTMVGKRNVSPEIPRNGDRVMRNVNGRLRMDPFHWS